MTSVATEAVNQLWLNVVTSYMLVPYRETQAQGQETHSGTEQSRSCEIPVSATLKYESFTHGRH